MTRAEIVAAARAYIGVRWRHQGRTPGHSLDCLGLLVAVADDLGLPVDDQTDYGRMPDGVTLRAELDRQLEPIAIDDMQPGDVLLMRFERMPQHVAILSEHPSIPGVLAIIHSYAQVRGVVEHILDDVWRKRIVAAYRLPGVED